MSVVSRALTKDRRTLLCQYCGRDFEVRYRLQRHLRRGPCLLRARDAMMAFTASGVSAENGVQVQEEPGTEPDVTEDECSSSIIITPVDASAAIVKIEPIENKNCQENEPIVSSVSEAMVATECAETDTSETGLEPTLNYKNSICPDAQKRSGEMEWLSQILSKQEKNVCYICQKSFVTKHLLNSHLSTHTEPQTCNFCAKLCCNDNALKRHMKHKHPDQSTEQKFVVACKICSTMFTSPVLLGRHHRAEHSSEGLTCQYCGKVFSKTILRKHLFRSKSCLRRLHETARPSCNPGDVVEGGFKKNDELGTEHDQVETECSSRVTFDACEAIVKADIEPDTTDNCQQNKIVLSIASEAMSVSESKTNTGACIEGWFQVKKEPGAEQDQIEAGCRSTATGDACPVIFQADIEPDATENSQQNKPVVSSVSKATSVSEYTETNTASSKIGTAPKLHHCPECRKCFATKHGFAGHARVHRSHPGNFPLPKTTDTRPTTLNRSRRN